MEHVKTKRIHWEKARGSRDDNVKYCSKDNGRKWYKKLEPEEELKIITDLYDWQQKIVNIISSEPDDRTIYWVYDPKGNRGKTQLCKYLVYHYDALICSGKASDMKHMIVKYREEESKYPKVILFDIPRSNRDFVSWSEMEEIKNGLFTSGKYKSSMVLMNSPHVICFANSEPDYDKISKDRWKILALPAISLAE